MYSLSWKTLNNLQMGLFFINAAVMLTLEPLAMTIYIYIYVCFRTYTSISKDIEKNVSTIPNDLPLPDNERSVLNKGNFFFLLESSFIISLFDNTWTLSLEDYAYEHTAMIKPNNKPTMQDPFLQIQQEDSKWTPNPGQCKMVDIIIEQIRRERQPYFVPIPLNYSNIS